ncbi:MAG: hypothetical protein V1792_11895 [Pseudomonadota bacterium]
MDIPKYVHHEHSWEYMKMADEIIEELWRIKDDMANECGYDVKAFVVRLKDKKHVNERPVVDLRSIRQTADQEVNAVPNHFDSI